MLSEANERRVLAAPVELSKYDRQHVVAIPRWITILYRQIQSARATLPSRKSRDRGIRPSSVRMALRVGSSTEEFAFNREKLLLPLRRRNPGVGSRKRNRDNVRTAREREIPHNPRTLHRHSSTLFRGRLSSPAQTQLTARASDGGL